MIIDRLHEEVLNKGNVCVGLDTHYDYIPEGFKKRFNSPAECILNYNLSLIDALKDKCAIFKVQISYYEALGLEGLKVYAETLKYIRKNGMLAISDIKRGDIAKTAGQYAKAHFEGDFESDFITVNPYMGMDSIEPYEEYIRRGDKGIFPLIRTSNIGARDIQFEKLENGKTVFEHTGDQIYELGNKYIGNCGYSSIGGVVGCTHEDESEEIRKRYKNMFFLIPGYGAQGGEATVVRKLLNRGNGGIVNSSRGILMAYKKYENGELNPIECAVKEVEDMRKVIGEIHE